MRSSPKVADNGSQQCKEIAALFVIDPYKISFPMEATIGTDPSNLARRLRMISYKQAAVDGSKIFYREAGPKSAPTILLLHGFPTSSHMFRNLIPALADRYHVVAPDLPGFGFSDAPDRKQFPLHV